ncbi:MAG: AsmA family protein, partial [Gammaproteobacteria bacterium]|nr:AsmA family protein [Gammaproteobacteria bacterium]
PKNKTNKSDKASTPSINVAGLSISDAVINWTDEQAKQKISLTKSNITISELIEDKPFNFQISTHIKVDDLAQSKQAAIEGDFSLETKPTISLSKQLFQLPGTLLSLDLKGDMLPGGSNKTTLSGDINFDGNTQLLDINKMSLTSDGLTADVAPENKAPAKLTGNIHFNGQTQVLDIKEMKLSALDLVVNGLFHAEKLSETPEFSGSVNIEKFSPKQLGAILGAALPAMKEAKALDSADVKMTFKGNTETMSISSLEANLDETSLKGTASIKNFKAPHYGFDLTLNQLNLDYYALAETPASKEVPVAETTPKKKETKKSSPSPKTNAPLFPVEMLRQLNLNGKLAIGQFIAGGAKMSNVVIVLKGKDGLVQLKPLKAQLYKGSINLNTDIDVRGKTPKLKIINKLNEVQIGDLLQDTTGSQEFTGQANINANITTSGNDNDRLVKNSNGKINLLITDGHVKKLDILDTLRKADALLKGRPTPTSSQEKNTKFTELKGTFKVKNGVVHNNDLASQSPVMSLTGKGYADFPKEYLDYTLKVKLLNSVKIDDKTQGTDYKGKEIPYTIKGKFSELSEEANISKVLEQEVKKSVEKKLNKKLEEKFGDKFKGMLKF